ncbi:hypothetical protein XarjCFBP7652_08980 [Xanthomonas arboricola]|nr:hypothetical protein XarjCFBP7652_08980 [Xanthomonas arboricola]
MADTVPAQRSAGQEAGDDRNAFPLHDWSRARSLRVRTVDIAATMSSSRPSTVSYGVCEGRLRWLYLVGAANVEVVKGVDGG